MDFYCKEYFYELEPSDQEWINDVVEYLLSHRIHQVGGYLKLKHHPDSKQLQENYGKINLKLLKIMKGNEKHQSHNIDRQILDDCYIFNGILNIVIESLEIIKLIETIQNEELFKYLATKNYDLQDYLNKKYYLIKTSPENYNTPKREIIFNKKPMLLADDSPIEVFYILSRLSETNDVFVTFNPYIIETEELGIKLEKNYGISFVPNQIINK